MKIKKPGDDCWLWVGSMHKLGYGILTRNNKLLKAHRYSWELFRGKIPDNINVLHKCDVRNCVNPSHLFLGTQKDNMRDCVKKGRHKIPPVRYGEQNHNSKLKRTEVEQMRDLRKNSEMAYKEIAKLFGVSTMTALRAIRGSSWK